MNAREGREERGTWITNDKITGMGEVGCYGGREKGRGTSITWIEVGSGLDCQ